VAHFTEEEWDAYLREGMAIQDERGALSLAEKQGEQRGREQGLQQGLEQGLQQGLEQGLQQGLEQGLHAMRTSIRKTLQRRGLTLSPEQHVLLEGCRELDTLERWFDQALSAPSASAAFQ
jgi:flagellar biosynthesis/type III secretory pathway protein FliH